MEYRVELDKKGRILIPAEVRKNLPSKAFILRVEESRIELIPLPDPRKLRGKYKINGSLEEIEELQETSILERF